MIEAWRRSPGDPGYIYPKEEEVSPQESNSGLYKMLGVIFGGTALLVALNAFQGHQDLHLQEMQAEVERVRYHP